MIYFKENSNIEFIFKLYFIEGPISQHFEKSVMRPVCPDTFEVIMLPADTNALERM